MQQTRAQWAMHKAGDGGLNMVLLRKEKEGTKKIRCAKKKKKEPQREGGKHCTFLQPCTGSKMSTMKFDTIHGALQSLVCRQNARLKSGGGKLA